MAGWSGLWNGSHGEDHALTASPVTPINAGLGRLVHQKRGSFGYVGALGRNTVATRQQSDHGGDITTRGGYDYNNRQNDPANQVTIPNAAQGEDRANSAVARVPNASESDMAGIYDTTLNKDYAADGADNGPATGGALAGRNPT